MVWGESVAPGERTTLGLKFARSATCTDMPVHEIRSLNGVGK